MEHTPEKRRGKGSDGRDGKGGAKKGREGKGREGRGREGKGREGKGEGEIVKGEKFEMTASYQLTLGEMLRGCQNPSIVRMPALLHTAMEQRC